MSKEKYPTVKIIPNDVSSDFVGKYIDDVVGRFKERGILVEANYDVTHSGNIKSVTLEFVGFLS